VPHLTPRVLAGLGGEFRALAAAPRTSAALRSTLASIASALIALWLHFDNPWWAAITGFVVIQQDAAATISRSVGRIVGTMIGALIGYVGAGMASDHLTFEVICASSTAFSIYGKERAEHGYAVLLSGVTALLVMFGSLAEPGAALHLAVYRSLEILVGVVAACAVDYALAPPASAARAAAKSGIWTVPVDRDLLVVAISGGIAIALIPMIWESLQLPGLGQTPITAFIILTALRHEPTWKAVTRACGCLLGALYGLAMMSLVGDAFLPWLAALAAGLFGSGHVALGVSEVSYVGTQAGVALIMAMIQGLAPSPDILPAIERLSGVFGGVLVVAICHPVLVPLLHRVLGWSPEAC